MSFYGCPPEEYPDDEYYGDVDREVVQSPYDPYSLVNNDRGFVGICSDSECDRQVWYEDAYYVNGDVYCADCIEKFDLQ